MNPIDNKLRLYHGAVTTAPLFKNLVKAKVNVAFGPESTILNFDMYGRSAADAKQKLLDFLSDKGEVELEQLTENRNMTKKQALIAMKLGEHVTHKYFLEYEFIRMEGDIVIDEHGYKMSSSVFWGVHAADEYETGWSVKLSV